MDPCEHCGQEHDATNLYCPKTGQLMAERLLPPHTMLEDKYLIGKPVGVGGMGAVFAATHTLLDKQVAIKVMLTSDEQAMARLVREARAASATGHPNIASVTDMGRTKNGSLFVVMEFLAGETLRALLERKPLGPRRALRLIAQVLAGLEVVHKGGIIHRDLKPDNVMVVHDAEGDEIVKILDFGISKTLRDESGKQHLTATGLVMGTPLYMSPEQARADEHIGPATDIYAVGAILYALVCGRPPHVAETLAGLIAAKLEQPPLPPSERLPELSAAFDRVVLRALAMKVEDRYPSAAALRQDVLALLDDPDALTAGAAAANKGIPRVGTASSPRASTATSPQDYAALDKLMTTDGSASLDELGLVTLDEAALDRSAPNAGALAPTATDRDKALPNQPSSHGVRQIEFDAGGSALPLTNDPFEVQREAQRRAGQEGRRVGGFSAEGQVAGSLYGGNARRGGGGRLRTLLLILLLAAIAGGGYWAYQRYLPTLSPFAPKEVRTYIDTTPAQATIVVDGVEITSQPLVLHRSSREFQVAVKARGYHTTYTSFQPERDQRLSVELRPLGDIAPRKVIPHRPRKPRKSRKPHQPRKPRRVKKKTAAKRATPKAGSL